MVLVCIPFVDYLLYTFINLVGHAVRRIVNAGIDVVSAMKLFCRRVVVVDHHRNKIAG